MAKQLNVHALPYQPQNPQPAVAIRVSQPPPPPPPAFFQAPYYFVYQCCYSISDLSCIYSYYIPSPVPAQPTVGHCDAVFAATKKVGDRPAKFSGRKKCQLKPVSSNSGGGGGRGGAWRRDSAKTTVMIKNIPNPLRRKMLVLFLDKLCEAHNLEYDFVYLPMDFKTKNNYGYAFVNFTSASAASRMKVLLQGYKWGRIETDAGYFLSRKICEITWANIQGRDALIRNFENKAFFCGTTEWLPVVFAPPRNGVKSASKQITVGKCKDSSS